MSKRYPCVKLLQDGMKSLGTVAEIIKQYSDGKFELQFLDKSHYCYSRKQFFLCDSADYPEWFV